MQISSKMLFKTGVLLLGSLLAATFFVAVNSSQANALDASQWNKVRGYIAEYFGGPQYAAGLEGEAGFRMTKADLWGRLDSNSNISPAPGTAVGSAGTTVTGVLGEGDNMANRPILIDNLRTQTGIIPGTEFRCNYNTNNDCFSSSSITAIREIVDNHKAAGFSTDIVDYCVSAHTAAPTTGGFGIIAQVPGALASDITLTPRVYTFEWARNGWRDNVSNAPAGAGLTAAPESSTGGFGPPSTVTTCDGSANDIELVRCQANWAIASSGGNTGNGQQDVAIIGAAQQSVDIRPGTISTLDTSGTNLQLPVNTLFDATSLAKIDPSKTVVLASRTQMGGDAAIGLEMLGYNNIANSYINGGLYRWSSSLGELQVDQEAGLPLQTIAAWDGLAGHPPNAPGKVDVTGPDVTSWGSLNETATTADITRTANEPATMKVEYGTAPGVYTDTVNNTVLNADKSVGLSGLSASTLYYFRITSYDGYANGTVVEGDFTTQPCTTGDPLLSLAAPLPFWGSFADYQARILSVTWTVHDNGADATNVQITGSTPNGAVTLITAMPANIGTIAAGSSGSTVIQYNVPVGYGGFHVWNTASAQNGCGTASYTYP